MVTPIHTNAVPLLILVSRFGHLFPHQIFTDSCRAWLCPAVPQEQVLGSSETVHGPSTAPALHWTPTPQGPQASLNTVGVSYDVKIAKTHIK